MKKNKKTNGLALFFTLAILEMVVVGSFYGFRIYQIASTSKALKKSSRILKEKTAEAEVASLLEKQEQEKSTEIKKLKSEIFSDSTLFTFLKNLDKTAKAYNLGVQSISFGETKNLTNTKPPVKELSLNIEMSGQNYDSLINFLSYLENKGYTIKPNSVSFNGSFSNNSGSMQAKANRSIKKQISMTFTIYVQTNSETHWYYGGE